MTFSSGKRKRRNTTGSPQSRISSSASQSSSPSARRRANTTDSRNSVTSDSPSNSSSIRPARSASDASIAPNNGRPAQRDRASSNSAAQRRQVQQNSDAQRRRIADDLDANVRPRDNAIADAPVRRNVPEQRQRARSLSDAAATIDRDATVPDLRAARARSLSQGVDPDTLRARRFDAEGIDALTASLDRTDIDSIPLVRKLSLDDSELDNDDDFIDDDDDLDDLELSIVIRRSSYDQAQSSWEPLPQEADRALEALQSDFSSVDEDSTRFPIERALSELLSNIYAADGSRGVSREVLNDVYFLAKEHFSTIIENPILGDLVDGALISAAEKERIDKMIALVKAIDRMPDRDTFLVPENAQVYNAHKLAAINLEAARPNRYERELARIYGPDLTGISFNRTLATDSEIHAAISAYRQQVMERLTTDLEALESLFKNKAIKKEHHREVLRAELALREAIEQTRARLNELRNADTETAVEQLHLAIGRMQTAAQSYINRTDHKNRVQSRIDAAQNVLDRIDQLLVTDDKIINARLEQSFQTLADARSAIARLGPEAALKFSEAMENLFFNASPEATAQTVLLDSLGVALGLAELNASAVSSTAFSNASNVSTGLGIDSVASAFLMDVAKAVGFIQDLKAAGIVTKQDLLNGGLILTNTTKNASSAVSTGIDIAGKVGTIGETVSAAGQVAGQVAGSAGIVIGAGFTVHGGLVAYKTGLRVSAVRGISDDQIRTQIMARIKKKGRRALLEAIGGVVAIVGGVLVIVATGGAAAPVVAGVGAAIALALASDRGISATIKQSKGTKGQARQKLAEAVFVHMNELLASGNYAKAKELAQALTNNKQKQNLMLRGADATADLEAQQAALVIMRDKLKTW